MSNQSLYRSYRPHSFSGIMGQEHVTKILEEEIKSGKIAHAYLFAGSRGLGKTSVARIFAKEIGCTDKDLYEIDAASNTGVDSIRELTANVYTLPFGSPYKVYLLDEAHMLSKSAWNAFLKTLEEPPAHVIFILATTEAEKVPETVRSRCQVFEFRKPTREGTMKLVDAVAKKEGYTLLPGVSSLIALLAEGSYRDALSTLQKLFSASGDTKITREEAEEITGAPRRALVAAFVLALSNGHKAAALEILHQVAQEDVSMPLYLSLVLDYMRNILLVRSAPELLASIKEEIDEDDFNEIAAIAGNKESKLTHTILRLFLEASSSLRYSPIPSLPLELAVLEALPE